MMSIYSALSITTEATGARRDQWRAGERAAEEGRPLDTYELLAGVLEADQGERGWIADTQTEAMKTLELFMAHIQENRDHYDELLRELEGKET